jgi:hypothetical protein
MVYNLNVEHCLTGVLLLFHRPECAECDVLCMSRQILLGEAILELLITVILAFVTGFIVHPVLIVALCREKRMMLR